MKTRIEKILCVMLLVVFSVMTTAAAPANHQPRTTHFTGSETFVELVDLGTSKVVNGKIFINGLVVRDTDTMSDPRVSGDLTVTVNAIRVGDFITGVGPMWGTIHLTNARGGWNIKFAGYQGENCHTIIYSQGKGEGEYQDLSAVWKSESDDCMLSASVSGTIMEHR